MTQGPGLRERKKERTRREIAEAARTLFGERGFDAVTVSEVAAAAEVSEATVFNYFPTKEDLFYSGLEAFEEMLLDAIGERPAGESGPRRLRTLHHRAARVARGDRAGGDRALGGDDAGDRGEPGAAGA